MHRLAPLTFLCLSALHAQPPRAYRVEFEIVDSRGAGAPQTRHFTMTIDESRKTVFQATNRISEGLDVGAKIECAVVGADGQVTLDGSIELSDIAGTVSFGGNLNEPIIGQRRIGFNKKMELAKTTAIDSSDKFQVTVTVTQTQ